MPLFNIDKQTVSMKRVLPESFADSTILERRDLQPLLRENFAQIDPDVLILSEEFGNWEGSSRRVDLLGLDRDANLVVIELKRVEDGSHLELQSLRYAAMLSSLDLNDVVEIHEAYLKKQGQSPASARQIISDFLKAEGGEISSISNKPRIVLIAPGFSREVTTTVLWLREAGLDMRCLEAKPYNLGGQLYLDVEQVIPLPSAQDYMFSLRKKGAEAKTTATIVRGERKFNRLVAEGILTPGVRVHLVRHPRSGMNITDDTAKWATFKSDDTQGFEWDYDHQMYSLSGLTRAVCVNFGGDAKSGAFPGPEYWAVEGEHVSLAERVKTLWINKMNGTGVGN